MPFDLRMRDALVSQDCLYTLVLKAPDGSWTPRVIGSIVEYLYAPDDPEAVIEKMADPATKIVSLTVTEGGYNFSPVTGEFDADEPAGGRRPRAGGGAADGVRPGHRGAGPSPRPRRGAVHGHVLRQHPGQRPHRAARCSPRTPGSRARRPATRGWATGWPRTSRSRTRWSTGSPRSPPTTTGRRSRERFGIDDAWPVVCEPFTQWVLEDHFTAGPAAVRGGRASRWCPTSSRTS